MQSKMMGQQTVKHLLLHAHHAPRVAPLETEFYHSKDQDGTCSTPEPDWACDLPPGLLELVFQHVKALTREPRALLAVAGVCPSWRATAQRLFFSDPWQQSLDVQAAREAARQAGRAAARQAGDGGSEVDGEEEGAGEGACGQPTIFHPSQLFQLAPHNTAPSAQAVLSEEQPLQPSEANAGAAVAGAAAAGLAAGPAQEQWLPPAPPEPAQHVQCTVQREVLSSGLGGRLYRFTLCQGAEAANTATMGRFLLAAVQESKQRYALHLARDLSARPVARLAANVMRTSYELLPEASPWMARTLSRMASDGAIPSAGCVATSPCSTPGLASPAPSLSPEPPHRFPAGSPAPVLLPRSASAEPALMPMPLGNDSTSWTLHGASASSLPLLPFSRAPSRVASPSSRISQPGLLSHPMLGGGAGGSCSGAPGASMAMMSTSDEGTSSEAGGGSRWSSDPVLRVRYKLRVRGMMLPRRMAVSVPCPPHLRSALRGSRDGDDSDDDCIVPGHIRSRAALRMAHAGHHHGSEAGLAVGSAGAAQGDLPLVGHGAEMDAPYDVAPVVDQGPATGSASGPAPRWRARAPSTLMLSRAGSSDSNGLPALTRLPSVAASATGGGTAGLPASDAAPVLHLQNKPPHWNEGMRCWCLNFRGRVKLASVKNFQLAVVLPPLLGADGTDGEAGAGFGGTSPELGSGVAMQFGKVDKDLFILDYDPTLLSAAQAFAIALTTFETKLLL